MRIPDKGDSSILCGLDKKTFDSGGRQNAVAVNVKVTKTSQTSGDITKSGTRKVVGLDKNRSEGFGRGTIDGVEVNTVKGVVVPNDRVTITPVFFVLGHIPEEGSAGNSRKKEGVRGV